MSMVIRVDTNAQCMSGADSEGGFRGEGDHEILDKLGKVYLP